MEEGVRKLVYNPRTKGPGFKTRSLTEVLEVGLENRFSLQKLSPFPLHPPSKYTFWNGDCCAWHTVDIQ